MPVLSSNKLVTVDQSKDIANGVLAKVRAKNYLTEVDDYTITKATTADAGYASTYQLFKGDTAVGDKINIPKDLVVESGTVETCETADTPVAGYQVGDKYIDLVIANATSSHIYILVSDLIDIYTAGNGIDITNNAVAVKIDSTNARGLSTGANGLALALATPSTSGAGGTAGAMSASDKEKLDNADFTAYTAGNGIDITAHAVSGVVDSSNANGLSVGANGFALATATTTTAGAMSAADKSKLDDADVTAYTAGNGISITNHAVAASVVDANGLSVGASGIAMAAVSASTSGTGGSNGAMLATDKEKLDGFEVATDSEITAMIAELDAL